MRQSDNPVIIIFLKSAVHLQRKCVSRFRDVHVEGQTDMANLLRFLADPDSDVVDIVKNTIATLAHDERGPRTATDEIESPDEGYGSLTDSE